MTSKEASLKTERTDVLSICLCIAALLHAAFILGVSFSASSAAVDTPPSLEVVLVQPRDDQKAPEQADYLAASSQDGGGENDQATRPGTPFAGVRPSDSEAIAPVDMPEEHVADSNPDEETVLTAVFADEAVADSESPAEELPDQQDPGVDERSQQRLEMAALAEEIARQQEAFAKRPKKKWLNARTRESDSAEYMHRWVEQVERVGNLNYPDEARRAKLTGALVLVVGIYKNGEIESISVDESSGHRVLDDAAVRIVQTAAPFDALAGDLARSTDILYIVRTWEFKSGDRVISY